MNMKKIIFVLLAVLLLTLLGCGISESKLILDEMMPPRRNFGPDGPYATIYTDYYGLVAPNSWLSTCLYQVTPFGNGTYSLSFYERESYLGYSGGELCTLLMVPAEDDSYNDFPDYELLCALSTQEDTFYVVALFPTDVQFNEETEEGYNDMYEELMDVLYTIWPVGDIEMTMP